MKSVRYLFFYCVNALTQIAVGHRYKNSLRILGVGVEETLSVAYASSILCGDLYV